MKLTVNGDSRETAEGMTLGGFLDSLGLKHDRVAVELNREIAPREQWGALALHEGDKLEIVHFVGGG